MKLLIDECVAHSLRRDLAEHEVHTVEDGELKGLENGELLKAAAGVYEVLITVDQNIPYQQNLGGLPIAILILAESRNSYACLKPLVPRTKGAVAFRNAMERRNL